LRNVRQVQTIAATSAVGDGAQAGARHLHGHGVIGIGEQQCGRTMRADFDHLAKHAAGVDQRLADLHARVAAGIEHEALSIRIEIDVEHAGELHVQAIASRTAKQLPQSLVFFGDGAEAIEPGRGNFQLAMQMCVFILQLAAQCEAFARCVVGAGRRARQPPHRLGDPGGAMADLFAVATAMIGNHQTDRERHVRHDR